jgi:hypothetical protein
MYLNSLKTLLNASFEIYHLQGQLHGIAVPEVATPCVGTLLAPGA